MLGPCPCALEGFPPPLPPRIASGLFTQSPALSCLQRLFGTPAHASALPLPADHTQTWAQDTMTANTSPQQQLCTALSNITAKGVKGAYRHRQ